MASLGVVANNSRCSYLENFGKLKEILAFRRRGISELSTFSPFFIKQRQEMILPSSIAPRFSPRYLNNSRFS
jgi:hypothetical protein